ncbi:MAG: DUF1501 domain-containing protein, partial [Blastocatellia bacterium]|nr:DUF1501 domain-containing protein [Blastocatellia bacterium]
MKKSRREFLKNSCRALTMTAVATQMRHFGADNVLAQEARDADATKGGDYKALVCIFMNGGNDGNNTAIPNYNEGYQLYANARQAQGLAIARSSLLPITPPSMGGQVWGLHPSLFAMHPLFASGKMAIVQNVGCLTQPLTRATYQAGAPRPYQLFSHPDQVEQARTAISSYKSTTGWGGRVADRTRTLNPGGGIPMVSSIAGATLFNIGANTSPLVVGAAPTPLNQVLALSGFGTAADEVARRAAMNNIRTHDLNYTMVQQASILTQQAVNASAALSTDPVLTVTFPNTTLGNQLKQVAKLLKFRNELNMSRQIFFCELGGFDHHTGQISPQNSLLQQFSQAVKAFYDETVAQGIAADVTTFTLSDFSRTLNPSGSGSNVGSDHGWGNMAFAIGGSVAGGNFYGRPTSNGTIVPTLVNGGPDDADV